MSGKFTLPKPIRYKECNIEYQSGEFSYIVAGAEVKCSQTENKQEEVELSTLYRGADTGFDIKVMDIDRSPENFRPDFGKCLKTGKKCVLTNMAIFWNNPAHGMGYAKLQHNEMPANKLPDGVMGPPAPIKRDTKVLREESSNLGTRMETQIPNAEMTALTKEKAELDKLIAEIEVSALQGIIYPLIITSTLSCYEGEGLIAIEKNGQHQVLAEENLMKRANGFTQILKMKKME